MAFPMLFAQSAQTDTAGLQRLANWRIDDWKMLTRVGESEMVNCLAITPLHGLSMSFVVQPWHLLLVVFAGWVNGEQQAIIAFNQVELDVLMKAQGKAALSVMAPAKSAIGRGICL